MNLAMDSAHVMLWGVGIIVAVTLVVGVIKDWGANGCYYMVLLPVLAVVVAILFSFIK